MIRLGVFPYPPKRNLSPSAKNSAKKGYVLAYVVVCVAVILSLLAMLLSMALTKNNIVRRSVNLIERKVEVSAIGEAFIGKKGELTQAELSHAVYTIVIENIPQENIPPTQAVSSNKRLTVSQGNKKLLIIEIDVSGATCKILRYDATW